MKMYDFRKVFEKNWLPVICGECVMQYIQEANEGRGEEFLQKAWKEMILKEEENPGYYPISICVVNGIWMDRRTCYSLILLPEEKNENLAIYAVVIYDKKRKKRPRFFVGETDYARERTIFMIEYEDGIRIPMGPLVVVKDEKMYPVEEDMEAGYFLGDILHVYQKEKNLLKNLAYRKTRKGMGEIQFSCV